LIERADRAHFWQSVTGSLDFPDEDLPLAAAREVLEETGIDVYLLPPDALQDMHYQIEYEIYPAWQHRYAPGVVRNTEHWFSLECRTTLKLFLPRESMLPISGYLIARLSKSVSRPVMVRQYFNCFQRASEEVTKIAV